jgi:hypothetical protein
MCRIYHTMQPKGTYGQYHRPFYVGQHISSAYPSLASKMDYVVEEARMLYAYDLVEQLLGEAVELGRSSWMSIGPPSTDHCYLRVYDLDYVHNESRRRLVGKSNRRATLTSDLESLPEQEAMFRVYLVEESTTENSALIDHLQFLMGTKRLNRGYDTFEALTSQWRELNKKGYNSTMYSFDLVEQLEHIRDDQTSEGLAFLAELIRIYMGVQVADVTGTKDNS